MESSLLLEVAALRLDNSSSWGGRATAHILFSRQNPAHLRSASVFCSFQYAGGPPRGGISARLFNAPSLPTRAPARGLPIGRTNESRLRQKKTPHLVWGEVRRRRQKMRAFTSWGHWCCEILKRREPWEQAAWVATCQEGGLALSLEFQKVRFALLWLRRVVRLNLTGKERVTSRAHPTTGGCIGNFNASLDCI